MKDLKSFLRAGSLTLALLLLYSILPAQIPGKSDTLFDGLDWRSIGPAFMSGRIADIAIHPGNRSTWYVGVGSGGVWKTNNAGTTWQPLFDEQSSYSIGCVTIDPHNPHRIWVGSGENVGGRHVGYGDGVYLSEDDGASWKNMGLKESQHISQILVHPNDPTVIWLAAQGPLWNTGGERGLYKSTDGGETWVRKLGDDKSGVTDLLIDPRNPDVLYAATWERHRNVAAYVGGGPGTGIYKSADGGEHWEQLEQGFPDKDMGKIGLAISPQDPDVIYAAIELERRKGAVYRSDNMGANWKKMSETVSGGTGPHYYQELYASPHKFDRIYLADVRMQISDDGGKTFRKMKEKYKHSDNHALTFLADEPEYLLVGTDGGIYESFDHGENWRFIDNLPVTQFYKLALDDTKPFYNIYGGTQDNNTQGGPSRTPFRHGIRNSDWYVTLFGDGHQPATEPGNPDIVYSEAQEGYIYRLDKSTGEVVFIQPQPDKGDPFERYNWDAPILISPHDPARLYYASQRVWRSEDRGDSWTAISDDITRNQERINLPIGGKTWSWDAAWDFYAMSTYNTITSLAESPVREGLLYAGTDDGIVNITEDGGKSWRQIKLGDLPGVPPSAFVNDIKADRFDENTVYLVLDNHKFGDLEPYILKSNNKGKTWESIRGNLPGGTLVWRIVQDPLEADLLFIGTEFGVYCSLNAGDSWQKLGGGMPTISVRDLAIQERENDLVAATFGRGFYVLDDYTPLRELVTTAKPEATKLFTPRKAWWYIEQAKVSFGSAKGSQGASYFTAPNPPFGSVFTYYLPESMVSMSKERKQKEEKVISSGGEVRFPGWEAVEKEKQQEEPEILLTIFYDDFDVVRRISGPITKGFHRLAWDLRYPSTQPLGEGAVYPEKEPQGILAIPGTYSACLFARIDGEVTVLSDTVTFVVERLFEPKLKAAEPSEANSFSLQVEESRMQLMALNKVLRKNIQRCDAMKAALARSKAGPGSLDKELYQIRFDLNELNAVLNGLSSKNEVGEKTKPEIGMRIRAAYHGVRYSTYGPTPNLIKTLSIAREKLNDVRKHLNEIVELRIPALEKQLEQAGAPWIEGQDLPD